MYAIVDIAGKQFKVAPEQSLYTPRLAHKQGEHVTLDKVLLLSDKAGKVTLGKPHIAKATVEAEVVAHGRAAKVIVFKKKRRKGYKKTQGHRQETTTLRITNIHTA